MENLCLFLSLLTNKIFVEKTRKLETFPYKIFKIQKAAVFHIKNQWRMMGLVALKQKKNSLQCHFQFWWPFLLVHIFQIWRAPRFRFRVMLRLSLNFLTVILWSSQRRYSHKHSWNQNLFFWSVLKNLRINGFELNSKITFLIQIKTNKNVLASPKVCNITTHTVEGGMCFIIVTEIKFFFLI